jgi:tetratricopeptide (TPR) repeat protein
MATPAKTAGAAAAVAAAGATTNPLLAALIAWMKAHRQTVSWIVTVLAIAAALGAWSLMSGRQTEARAARDLVAARLAFESRNYPLAGSELSRIAENYSGTRAAEEATLLLAQVRLWQGQSQLAVEQLARFAPRASRDYQAQAYGLLGAANENLGRLREAGDAYESAAKAAGMPFLRAQYLSDAGRAWVAAGDTAKGLSDYREIVTKLDSTGTVTEAKVRIGELTRGSGLP